MIAGKQLRGHQTVLQRTGKRPQPLEQEESSALLAAPCCCKNRHHAWRQTACIQKSLLFSGIRWNASAGTVSASFIPCDRRHECEKKLGPSCFFSTVEGMVFLSYTIPVFFNTQQKRRTEVRLSYHSQGYVSGPSPCPQWLTTSSRSCNQVQTCGHSFFCAPVLTAAPIWPVGKTRLVASWLPTTSTKGKLDLG